MSFWSHRPFNRGGGSIIAQQLDLIDVFHANCQASLAITQCGTHGIGYIKTEFAALARERDVIACAGAAGITTSRTLGEAGVEHLVLERGDIGNTWSTQNARASSSENGTMKLTPAPS